MTKRDSNSRLISQTRKHLFVLEWRIQVDPNLAPWTAWLLCLVGYDGKSSTASHVGTIPR